MLLEIVSPEASLFKGEITSVSPVDGFQILNNHAPIVSLFQKDRVQLQVLSLAREGLFTKVLIIH
jgi:F-type H+-transporting ATPase subunit epsilon